jgi:hypothetical protein
MKKFIATTFIILIAASAIFFVGWIQFWVPTGMHGVMVSKTGGVNALPVEPGKFRWQWERLIPTNAKLVTFDLAPVETVATVEGKLPSADLYGAMLEGKPDFSWSFSVTTTARLSPSALPSLVKAQTVTDQASLREYLDKRIAQAADDGARKIVADFLANPGRFREFANDRIALAKLFMETANGHSGDGIEFTGAEVKNARLPDFELYALASGTYASYQERKTETMDAVAKAQATASVADYLEIERFQALGEVLTKYPILIDYLAVTGEGSLEAFKTIRERK